MKTIKKVIIFIILCILLGLGPVSSVWAKNGPHMGPNFPEATDACASCHRSHTALGPFLLADGTSIYAFCTSCHDGRSANTNVEDGRFEGNVTNFGSQGDGTAGNGLNGGGFLNAFAYSGRSGRSSNWSATTSRHRMNGLDNESTFIAWGGGETGPGTDMPLDCTSCHNPHGTENSDGGERYRNLENTVNGNEVGDIVAHEAAGKDYTSVRYSSGFTAFCTSCHTQYLTKTSTYDAGDGQSNKVRYRHRMSISVLNGDGKTGNGKSIAQNLNEHIQLPVEQTSYSSVISGENTVICLTCHQVHGSSANMSDSAKVSPADDSTLLRLAGRGVCQDCHER